MNPLNRLQILTIIGSMAIISIVVISGFSIQVAACAHNKINVGLDIFSSNQFAICTVTTTITATSTTTTFVGVNTPYNYGVLIALILILAVIILFYLLKGKVNVK